MILRLVFFAAASIAAYALRQITLRNPNSKFIQIPENEDEVKQDVTRSSNRLKEEEEEEEEEVHKELQEEVKLINSIINPSPAAQHDFGDNLLPELESIDFPLPSTDKHEQDRIYKLEVSHNAKELNRLQNTVRELEERECKLEGELLEYHGLKEQESSVSESQKQLKVKAVEIDMLNSTINSLQAERKKLQEEVSQGVAVRKELETARKKLKDFRNQVQMEANQTKGHLLLLKQQVSQLQAKEKEALEKEAEVEKKMKDSREMEVEVMELKRKNKELQCEKRELAVKLEMLSNMTEVETEMVAKVREEVNSLRHTNEDLVKQVEGLQMNRFSEVEELVYLRWVNACLRFELRNFQNPSGKVSARDLNKSLSPRSRERAKQLMLEYADDMESSFDNTSVDSEDLDNSSVDSLTSRFSSVSKKASLMQKIKRWGRNRDDHSPFSSPARSTSIGTGDRDHVASSFQVMSKSVEAVSEEKYPAYKDRHKLALEREKTIKEKAQQARAVKFEDPLKGNGLNEVKKTQLAQIEKRVTRVPRPPPKVKADVETQGDFVLSLASEVRGARFARVEDVVSFVEWLDEELSFLVDERAVIKHFDWPEGKADALREASFEYKDLVKLEKQVSEFTDDTNLPCEAALRKMYKLLEKVEKSVYALLRTRDMAVSRYKEFGIPVDWLLDSGIVGKIKISSVQLARKYMRRVTSELDAMTEPEKEPNKEYFILQGVRFAFRVHQFAGGFDAESMTAFEELRGRARTQNTEKNEAET